MPSRAALRSLLLAITLTWGFAFTAIKLALEEITPGPLTLFRFVFGCLALLVALVVVRTRTPTYTRGDWVRIGVMSVLGMMAYHWSLNWGIQYITPSTAALLVATNPLMTYMLSTATGTEPRSARRQLGVVVAFGGAAVIILYGTGGARLGVESLVGALVTLIAPVSWSIYTVIGKNVSRRNDPLLTMSIITALGTVLLIPAGLVEPVPLQSISFDAWLAVAYLGVLSSGAAYLGWMYCLRHMEPSEVSSSVYLVPMFAVSWDVIILGTRPALPFYAGAALVLAGLALALGSAGPRRGSPTPAAGVK